MLNYFSSLGLYLTLNQFCLIYNQISNVTQCTRFITAVSNYGTRVSVIYN